MNPTNSKPGTRRMAITTVAVIGPAVLGLTPVAVSAQSEHAIRTAQAAAGMSLDEAVQLVRRTTGARVVRAESRRVGGRTVHFIRVLTEAGHVRTMRVDAATGEIL